MKATEFLQAAMDTQAERGKEYDQPGGERSMGRTVQAFNTITGRDLTEAEGWLLLQVLKDVRQWQNPGRYHYDSALDGVAYSALKAEALSAGYGSVTYSVEQVLGFDPKDPNQWMPGDVLEGESGTRYLFAELECNGRTVRMQDDNAALLSNLTWVSRPEAKPVPIQPNIWLAHSGYFLPPQAPGTRVQVKYRDGRISDSEEYTPSGEWWSWADKPHRPTDIVAFRWNPTV